MALSPITYEELFTFEQLGVDMSAARFHSCTLQSDKWLCVREAVAGKQTVVVADLAAPKSCVRRNIQADSALMHPRAHTIALKLRRAGQSDLQVYDLDASTKLKQVTVPEEVLYWSWVSDGMIGFVTATSVWHWPLEGDAEPVKMFDRTGVVEGCQIVSYRADESLQWLLLVTIAGQAGRVAGQLQLHSVARSASQIIPGHCGAFVRYTLPGRTQPSTLLCFGNRDVQTAAAKLYIVEVGPAAGAAPHKLTVPIPFADGAGAQGGAFDFAVSSVPDEKHGLVWLLSKHGFLFMFDVETGAHIYRRRITADTAFATAPHIESGGFVGVTHKGQVLRVAVDESVLVPYVLNLPDLPQNQATALGIRLAARCGLPGAEAAVGRQFASLFSASRYEEAAKVAAESPGGALRTPETIERFKAIGDERQLLAYFQACMDADRLNAIESLELGRIILAREPPRTELIERWLQEGKLTASEALGDALRAAGAAELAVSAYVRAAAHHKAVAAFVRGRIAPHSFAVV